jgi:hypothetical protein
MFAKIDTSKEYSNARNMGRDKETVRTLTALVSSGGEICDPVEARFYMGRSASASVVYCSIWIRGRKNNGMWNSGHGSAGGYGYHKESAALQEALDSAGVSLFGPVYYGDRDKRHRRPANIGGVGDSAMRDALVAVTRALGYCGKVRVTG